MERARGNSSLWGQREPERVWTDIRIIPSLCIWTTIKIITSMCIWTCLQRRGCSFCLSELTPSEVTEVGTFCSFPFEWFYSISVSVWQHTMEWDWGYTIKARVDPTTSQVHIVALQLIEPSEPSPGSGSDVQEETDQNIKCLVGPYMTRAAIIC